MKLRAARIQNYRSIDDSGIINLNELTVLVGRNESGKSNILKALSHLKSRDEMKDFDMMKDYPNHKRIGECTEETEVIWTCWDLEDMEISGISKVWPEIKDLNRVYVSMNYGNKRIVEFDNLPAKYDIKGILPIVEKVLEKIKALSEEDEESPKTQIDQSAGNFKAKIGSPVEGVLWVHELKIEFDDFESTVRSAIPGQLPEVDGALEKISEVIDNMIKRGEANDLIIETMPVFIYFDKYPDLVGEQNITEFQNRKNSNMQTPADINFEKMCKVAGLDIENLQGLLTAGDLEAANRLIRNAEVVLTEEIQRLWTDRPVKVDFYVTQDRIITFVANPHGASDIQVNLSDRSRGFQWFFSFYVVFAADAQGGSPKDPILLFDEPGLHLHAKSQKDLVKHFMEDFKNQIIYSTHSPFMVPTGHLEIIRTVSIDKTGATVVSNNISGDKGTLFPLQAAIGHNLSQSLFVKPNSLVVQEVADCWVITKVSDFLNKNKGETGLNPNISVIPAGAANKVSFLASFLSSERLNVNVLFAEHGGSYTEIKRLMRENFESKNIILISELFDSNPPDEIQIEDLFDPKVYDGFVREAYGLKDEEIKLNSNTLRVCQRYKNALKNREFKFNRSDPLRVFNKRMQQAPQKIISGDTEILFRKLFKIINERFS